MPQEIILNGRKIQYVTRISKRSRSLRLTVHHDGSLAITTPRFVFPGSIERFIRAKEKWILSKIDYFKSFKDIIKIGKTEKEYQELRGLTLDLVRRKLQEFNVHYNFKYNKILIKSYESRWGTCSKKGDLSFNYKIAVLSERLAEYIVVHELCHIGEFNHSKNFWDLVARTIPDFKDRRNELRKTAIVIG